MPGHLIAPHGGRLVELVSTPERRRELLGRAARWPSWDLSARQLCDLELLLGGGFSPLRGFLGRTDYESVCARMRLADGTLWPIPVTLDVSDTVGRRLGPGAKNHGADHFIVGRDHAGPGMDRTGRPFYDPYQAQDLLGRHQAELGIRILPFRQMVYVVDADAYLPEDEVPSGARTRVISGTKLRSQLDQGRPLPAWSGRRAPGGGQAWLAAWQWRWASAPCGAGVLAWRQDREQIRRWNAVIDMRAPTAASGLIEGESAPLSTATPARAGLRHLRLGRIRNGNGRSVGRRGLTPWPSAATAQSRPLSKLDLEIALRPWPSR